MILEDKKTRRSTGKGGAPRSLIDLFWQDVGAQEDVKRDACRHADG